MLKIDRESGTLAALEAPSFAEVDITERYDLQKYIANSPDAFFSEFGEELFVLGTEFSPSDTVKDRIDLLAVDREGTLVIVELKRGAEKLQMLQAISYAGMIAEWSPEAIMSLLDEDQRDSLADFLDCDVAGLNDGQRIVLIAEGYDFALLSRRRMVERAIRSASHLLPRRARQRLGWRRGVPRLLSGLPGSRAV
ncbi:MAG: hypothetical protein AAFV43_05425 [Planctomycetota bacterium]